MFIQFKNMAENNRYRACFIIGYNYWAFDNN